MTVIAGIGILGSLGHHTSPVWLARAAAIMSNSPTLQSWLSDLGPIDPANTTTIRPDGYLRDCDGGFYWWLTTVLPGFRQFRYPPKLFVLTALALAALAGLGWDTLCNRRSAPPIRSLLC